VLVHPLQWNRVEVIPPHSALPARDDKSGADEHVEVLHHREARRGKCRRQVARGARSFAEQVEDGAAGGIAQRAPEVGERIECG